MTHQPTLVGLEEVFNRPLTTQHQDLLQFPEIDAETRRYHGKQFGRAGELLVESVFLSLGLQSVGVAEHSPFDCVVFLEQGVLRVQVKTVTRPRGGCFNFNVSRGYHRSPAGVRRYSENAFDLLALVCLSENVVKFTADRRRSQSIGVEEIAALRRRPGASFEAAMSDLGVDQLPPAPAGLMPFAIDGGANCMTEFLQKSPLFPTAFSADLARTTVAALRENALSEWKSNADRFYDYVSDT